MNYGKLNDWLQVSANIGIVLGLLLVGIQLKQNSDLLKVQLLYEESYRAIELETKVVGENAAGVWAKSITDPKSMSLEEQRIMEAILWSFVEGLRGTRKLAELGLLDKDEWKERVNSNSAFYLANEYGVAWWTNFGLDNSALPDDLKAAVNARLSAVDNEFTLGYFKGVMDLVIKQDTNGS